MEPEDLTKNFTALLGNKTIATGVEMKVRLPACVEFRNENAGSLSKDKSTLTKQLGNVTSETEITFEYRLKSAK